jgi:hypothetical protein
MNKHYMIDKAAITIGALFFPKYFRDGVESASFQEHLQGINVNMPKVAFKKSEYSLTSITEIGEVSAGFRLAQWLGEEYPTIIYHHGASEIPFDFGFKNIFPLDKEGIAANLFLIRAAYHDNRKNFMIGMSKTENWLVMMANSVKIIELIIKQVRANSTKQDKELSSITVSGTSLGGFITNLHHIHYNSADKYRPLLAGTAMHDAFLNSAYSKSVAKTALAQPVTISKLFDFQADFANQDNSNVFPLLAVQDGIIRYDIQKASYNGLEAATIHKGHTTGALAYDLLRQHILI